MVSCWIMKRLTKILLSHKTYVNMCVTNLRGSPQWIQIKSSTCLDRMTSDHLFWSDTNLKTPNTSKANFHVFPWWSILIQNTTIQPKHLYFGHFQYTSEYICVTRTYISNIPMNILVIQVCNSKCIHCIFCQWIHYNV